VSTKSGKAHAIAVASDAGAVGIGTTSPAFPFEVVPGSGSSFSVSHESSRPVVRIADSSTEHPVLQFSRNNAADYVNLEYTGSELDVNRKIKISSATTVAPLNVPILTSDPTSPSTGDVWIRDSSGTFSLKVQTAAGIKSVTLS